MAAQRSYGGSRLQFIKVLMPGFLEKLKIPPKFSNYLKRENHQVVTLFSRHFGKFWHVDLHKDGESLCLTSGWSDFATVHKLRHGYFLLFRYEGNMLFSVKIFDHSCTPKDYNSIDCKYVKQPETCTISDPNSENGRKNSKDDEDGIAKKSPDKSRKKKGPWLQNHVFKERKSPSSSSKMEGRVLSQVEKIIKPYNLMRCCMSFPKQFCSANGLSRSKRIVLQESTEERQWPIDLRHTQRNQSYLGKGWSKFAKENNLEVGDKCIFQLVSKNLIQAQIIKREVTEEV